MKRKKVEEINKIVCYDDYKKESLRIYKNSNQNYKVIIRSVNCLFVNNDMGKSLIEICRDDIKLFRAETRRHVYYEESSNYNDDENKNTKFDKLLSADFAYDNIYLISEQSMLLKNLIKSLTPEQQSLLKEIYENGEKQYIIAKKHNISEAAISKKLKTIYSKLRHDLLNKTKYNQASDWSRNIL